MSVTMTDDEFAVVHEAVRLATEPYTVDELPHIIAMEAKARKVLDAVSQRTADLPA